MKEGDKLPNGKFAPGNSKPGGRKKGTPNKVTAAQKSRISAFFEKHWDEFENEIWPTLTAKDKKDTFIALINYQYPKLTSVDLKDDRKQEDSTLDMLRKAVNDANVI